MKTFKSKVKVPATLFLRIRTDMTVQHFPILLYHVENGEEMYDEKLISNRRRKEFESSAEKDDVYIAQTSATVNKRKSMVKVNPKTTIEKFNKAIEIFRDLATFISCDV